MEAVASSLLRLGVKPGDRVGILSENRPEWVLLDLAALSIGAVTVPIYTSLSSAEIQHILADAGVNTLAVSQKTFLEKVILIQKDLPALARIVVFEAQALASQSDLSIPLFLIKDWEKDRISDQLMEMRSAVQPDSLASIIYTSGTTGAPKGVMLTHDNFIQNLIRCRAALQMSSSDVHLSFLPLSHVFERTAGYYLMVTIGATIAYAESLDTVIHNLAEVRPTFILGVPRFYEKIRDRVLESLSQASPFKKKILKTAVGQWLARRQFKKRLGGRVRFCVSGGAPLARDIAEFFYRLGIMIYEGYGLTETSPVISVNRQGRWRFGTIGIPLDGIEVKIAPDGEILTKGPCVMKGYWNKPDATRDAIKDGWFHTGDLGLIDQDGFLAITGRKKELIVTSNGKKVSPRAIEERMEKDIYIQRCVLFGEGKKCVTALIVPRKEKLLEYATIEKIAFKEYSDLLRDDKIRGFFEQRVEEASADLASFEKIKYFGLLENDFSQNAGELTPTLKVKRDVVWARYKDLLLPFYESGKNA